MTTDADSQSMVMTIDQGNSSAKLDVWKGLEPVRMLRLEELSVEMLLPLLGDDCFDGCVYCSVGHTDAKFLETLRRLMDWRMIVLTSSTPLPISIGYAGRETLGGDRVAAAAGAALLYSGECVLVVDSGTAVTIDLLDSHGCFVGGNISPGWPCVFARFMNRPTVFQSWKRKGTWRISRPTRSAPYAPELSAAWSAR